MAERLPILMTSQYAFPPTDLWEFYGIIRPWLPAAVMAWSVAVLVGIAWWLWLTPSVLGLLIVLLFLAGAVWPAWRLRRVR